MKKYSAVLTALAAALSLTGCRSAVEFPESSGFVESSSFTSSYGFESSPGSSSLTEQGASSESTNESAPPEDLRPEGSQPESPRHELEIKLTTDYDEEFFADDLFIGDSIFTGLYLYSYTERDRVAAVGGYTPYRAVHRAFDEDRYPGSAADYAKEKQPRHIIIMLGSNGLSPDTDLEEYIKDYRELLNTLRADCPNSVICVVSVPPITAYSSMAAYSGITNALIDELNEKILALCGELNAVYCDLNSVLKDKNGCFDEEYAYDDGMHFVGKTYPVLLSRVEKTLTYYGEARETESVSALSEKTTALAARLGLSEMTEIAADDLSVYFDLGAEDIVDFSVRVNASGASPDEFGVFTAVDGSAAAKIEAALNKRIEQQRKAFEDYIPAEMFKFYDCFVEVSGCTVVYAVCADNSLAKETLI
ncbi:MAG: DUF4358 domain-containing protein [Oscillospiraceae bacterium]|nr:DUF4358 domain-containing protein [Oscillospiraceae bacterium]